MPVAERPQPLVALERANIIRSGRAEIKRQIYAGTMTVTDVLAEPGVCSNMTLGELLTAQYRWGKKRMRRFCSAINVSEVKRVGTFTERQRGIIAELLGSL